jgi:cytochrome c
MTTSHGMMSVKGKPDVQGSTCMKDCVQAVKVTSELPEFARNQHGNLAEQTRAFGPVHGIDTTRFDPSAKTAAKPAQVAAAAPAADPKALLAKNACTACHGVSNKVVGPAFTDVAAKYQGKADVEAYLTKKIRSGGEGVWGAVPMPPQSASNEDIQAIAKWIAGGAK